MTGPYGYFDRLHARMAEGTPVTPRDASKFGVVAASGKCHENADRWATRFPNDKAVRGWIVTPMGPACLFEAHSVLEGQNGELFDVTLADGTPQFLRHVGAEEDYWAAQRGRYFHWYPPELRTLRGPIPLS